MPQGHGRLCSLLLCKRKDRSATGAGTCLSSWGAQEVSLVGVSAMRGWAHTTQGPALMFKVSV